MKAHKRCAVRAANNCKWSTLASVGKHVIEDSDGTLGKASLLKNMYHFIVSIVGYFLSLCVSEVGLVTKVTKDLIGQLQFSDYYI